MVEQALLPIPLSGLIPTDRGGGGCLPPPHKSRPGVVDFGADVVYVPSVNICTKVSGYVLFYTHINMKYITVTRNALFFAPYI
jgi:hypothetical protein